MDCNLGMVLGNLQHTAPLSQMWKSCSSLDISYFNCRIEQQALKHAAAQRSGCTKLVATATQHCKRCKCTNDGGNEAAQCPVYIGSVRCMFKSDKSKLATNTQPDSVAQQWHAGRASCSQQ
eukprot:TRINITY_DN20487_c0_g1_i1.p1 TRINITY_DN20487_c0_g1~~TRINITY_DN20487_c0_g1_i1.p1  ORF type:complete len:121 (-),score=10.09 TRINITY_DN20487_c0_g1_i1:383-745(-)